MNLKEAAQQALEALSEYEKSYPAVADAFKPLRTALAQQTEPVEPMAVVATQSDVWRGHNGQWAPLGEPIKMVQMLRRLHAENASLSAALASSCDEQRHELWESGGIAGCDRARVAERQRDALLEALKLAWPIIEIEKSMQNGCYGNNFIQSKAERARKAYEAARAAIKLVEETK